MAAAKAPERENEVRAEAKYVRVSARKARLVTEHIRGRSVPEARTVLAFTERAVAKEIEKVLHSAVSNAEANHGMIGDELFVSTVYVDEGPTIKRWRARARGRVARINKRTCHITVKVAPLEKVQPAAAAPAAEEAAATKAPRKRAAAAKTPAKKATTRKKKEATA
jgi:large subunit ribosomal protein L22